MTLLIGFLDLTSNTQMLGLAAAALSTPFVNPPPKNNGDKRLLVSPAPLFVRLIWGDGLPHDLDLWVRCYNLANGENSNVITIGFNRTSDGWLDLLRDDQGAPSYINEERVQSNSEVDHIPANTACGFNVHLYHSHGGHLPVEGQLTVIQNKDSDNERLVGDVHFTILVPGQEITVLKAVWDDHSNLIQEAVEKFPSVDTKRIATIDQQHGGLSR
ncbi:MAG TPA: hypothetical protein VMU25_00685 [Candidatus Paceibacterota bacterium]|nr:hypothetical protein [Candidatus Paceibacterota bacterium]